MRATHAQRCKSLIAAAVVAALTIGLAGCVADQSTPGTSTTDDRRKTVIIARAGEVTSVDPVNADYAQADIIASTLYDTLVTYDDSGKVAPRLATQFELSDDAKTITLTLREDVTFHDGAKLQPADVVYSLDRYKAIGRGVANFISGYASSKVQGTNQVVVNLAQPDSLALGALSKIYILNSKLVEQNAGSDQAETWLANNDAGSGAYTLKQGPSAGDVNVALFDQYWDKADGRPVAMIFRRIDESATQRDALKAADIDIALSLVSQDAAALNGAEGITSGSIDQALQTYVFFNTTTGPTADPKVRKAIQLAYDYAGGLKSIRGGFGDIATGPLPTTLPCRPDTSAYAQDVDRAKKLLAESGQSNLKLTMRFQPAFPAMAREATLFQSNLKDIGIDLQLEPIAFPDYLKSLQNAKTIPQLALIEDFSPYPDPGVMLIKGYRSTAKGSNKAGYSNPKVDDLLTQAETSGDADQRCRLYQDAQKLIIDDAPSVNMYTVAQPAAWRSDIQGVVASDTVLLLAPAATLRVS